MAKIGALLVALILGVAPQVLAKGSPNVIFFAVDDLCDWVGAMGHTQAKTPNMDALAKRGVSFNNAHCPGVFCAPSRSAIFTGQFASTTGCYRTEIYYHNHPELRPLQVSFAKAGYATYGAGKLFHHSAGYIDHRGWTKFFLRNEAAKREGWPLDSWGKDTPLPDPFPNSIYNRGRQITGGMFLEWAAIPNEREKAMADTKRVNWACDVLKQKHDKPFFLAVGLYAPHFPNYVPKKYFDLYDAEKIKAPVYKEDDLDDLPPLVKRRKINRKRQHHGRLVELGAIESCLRFVCRCDVGPRHEGTAPKLLCRQHSCCPLERPRLSPWREGGLGKAHPVGTHIQRPFYLVRAGCGVRKDDRCNCQLD
jgi:arylsulfatase A-like enzyme